MKIMINRVQLVETPAVRMCGRLPPKLRIGLRTLILILIFADDLPKQPQGQDHPEEGDVGLKYNFTHEASLIVKSRKFNAKMDFP
jgi:hypothetical protein